MKIEEELFAQGILFRESINMFVNSEDFDIFLREIVFSQRKREDLHKSILFS